LVVGTRSGSELREVPANSVKYRFGETIKISVGQLKNLLREAFLLEEKGELPEESDDSLDSQVDRYLSQYEGEAKSSKTEGLDFRMLTRRILGEAGEDEEEGGDVAGEPAKLALEDIDIDSFANGVVRLIENYDSLLEVRSTLARRAINFVAKSYDPEVVEALKTTLRDDHGIVPGESEQDTEDELYTAPRAARAGDGGGGAAA
jgi:hypothetical protein